MPSLSSISLGCLAAGSIALSANELFDAARPILEQNCLECHHADEGKGGLKLHTHDDFLLGGDEELAFDEKSPKDSELLRRVRLPEDHEEFMPPSSEKVSREALTPEEMDTLEKWLLAGAPWPKDVILVPKEKTAPLENPDEPDPLLAGIEVFPSRVSLETASDYHRLVILATAKDASTRDVSASVKISLADPKLARVEGTTLHPLADGETIIRVDFRGKSREIPLVVKDATRERTVSFQQDIVPIFTAAGCNTGSCHGSARGQDGFMLSLFGYDPEGDYDRITREQLGRRINLALPSESLLLTKSIGEVPHTGGKLFDKNHPFYATMLSWLEDGANYDPDDIPLPIGITVEPAETVLKGPRQRIQQTVRAEYADGTDRDVTTLSSFTSSNDSSVKVNPNNGKATSGQRGEAFLMARFHTFTEGTQNIVIPADAKYEKPSISPNNYIDEHVHAKLHKLRMIPSELADDETFVRRIYLDLVGLLPTPEERAEFLADSNPDKRAQLIDSLLERKEFTEIWVMKWAELLQIRSTGNNANQVTYKAATLWYEWLREKVASGVPFDQIVRELLATRGGTLTEPQTNYYKLEQDIKKVTENVAQVFLGTRIQCAQCHNHPFDRWTMDDYYGFASFFAQVKRKRAEDPHEQIVFDANGEIQHPLTKKNAIPTFLGGEPLGESDQTRREAMADWLTSPENPWFAGNISNIVWSHFFGIGIVNPVDDARISNPPSNPALLASLGDKLVEYNFDIKRLVRDICNSRTYQLSTIPNETNALDETNFSKSRVRRLRAEVLLDVLAQVTDTPNKFKGLPLGARAVQIADGQTSNYFLTTFGRATRATVCSCEVVVEPNLSQALHLLNGESTHTRIYRGKVVNALKEKNKGNAEQIITDLYLRTLSREPNSAELQHLLATFKETPDDIRGEFYPDLFWALLNSKEFIFNH
ncbi:PSD1 and planctomycete cytochrome C domain-containing protein [Roseibacillus persicicus]|uniref:PSD1 and planctomycete cytochrome C domain-containing protein n=1 Tax=Roseibacillus persicicus TaxID=454148 RepID=UPI0028101F75|nr:PSD1 and planctomycete cytochrome C domain-containing protein [Roseibacillus persicicus]MDQ8191705.1 PSD1 and planctomycete cytochrome C domain-containing protein [Roseibacillus persicicus]